MNPQLPACCTKPTRHWPLPVALPGAILFSNHFDPGLLGPEDFLHSGVDAPANIQRSVAKRQAEYLAGRLCARAALQEIIPGAEAPAPGPDRAPVWAATVCGSITHSDGWAAAIAAPVGVIRGLGLDAETLLAPARAERLAGEILTDAELQRLALCPAELRAQAITLTFSIKESLFKALYPLVLRRFYFEHAEVLSWQPTGQVRLRLLIDLSAEFRHGHELDGQFCITDGRLLSLVHL
jgi:enterobactin synthetase component D